MKKQHVWHIVVYRTGELATNVPTTTSNDYNIVAEDDEAARRTAIALDTKSYKGYARKDVLEIAYCTSHHVCQLDAIATNAKRAA